MRIVKTHKYMEPVEYDDGHGFRSIVELEAGQFALISEIHRQQFGLRSLDETLVFRCDPDGMVAEWGEVYSASSTQDAIACVDDWRPLRAAAENEQPLVTDRASPVK